MATEARRYAVDARACRTTEGIFEFHIRIAHYVSHIGCALASAYSLKIRKIVADQQKEVQDLSRALQSLDARIASKEKTAVEQNILDWLCDYNYQAQHHRAYRLHCDNTSSWILEHPTFLHWTRSREPVLWFRGVPGSGKTVLASYVTEYFLQRQSPTVGSQPVVLFYCDKSTNQSLSLQTFLASALRQLCIQAGTPPSVKEAFSAAKLPSGGLRPINISQLTSMVRRYIVHDPPCIVIVDGIDESEDIPGICDFLTATLESGTKFFISSRQHNVIADALPHALKMSAPSASASSDIAQYIHQRLHHDQRLRKMAESLKSYVRETLSEKAAGM